MKKVLAIISCPQECGLDTIDFVSLEDGQIIHSVNITGFSGAWETIRKENYDEIVSKPLVTYDACVMQRYPIGDFIEPSRLWFENEDCTKRMRFCGENLAIQGCEKIKELDRESLDGRPVYSWKYVFAEVKRTTKDVYHPEDDDFYHRMKNAYNLDLPFPIRKHMQIEDFIELLSFELLYNVVNILKY